ncbi:hypothetical protein MNBD_GAMMA22-5 [hydrothermal vent metagenome]|uniref:J domain-containing protein n=1 Tax=hydrothermal vent metagenome TaxID=652676 RepID=A0A3B1AMU5_9ZZZZ
MNDTRFFNKYYKILNLSTDSDLQSCRYSYKKSVKQWHPDKFNDDLNAQRLAEEKLKEINIAYANITDYYNTYGKMPIYENPSSSSENNKQEFDVSSLYENLNANKLKKPRIPKKYFGFFLVIIILILIYQIPLINQDNKNTALIENISNNTDYAQTSKDFFSEGSTYNDVIKIHGEPEFSISQTWYYGNSWVLFKNGVVVDWYQDKKFPLKAISKDDVPYVSIKSLPDTFEKGDSKADVRSIQGEPVRKSRDVWYYQISKIRFKNNKVVSWFDSPLDPLKIKR